MLNHFKIKSSLKNYEIFFIKNLKIITKKNNCIVICDFFFKNILRQKNFIYIKALEKNKSYDYLKKVFIQLVKKKVNRDHTIVAIGGGVIQDIACYISSIYMRGLEWVYYPTTLLGMTDSCIGGKSSVNLDRFKNILGTYNPPSKIFINTNFLKTLKKEDLICGIIEAIKILYVKQSFHKHYSFLKQFSSEKVFFKKDKLKKLIYLSLLNKKKIIEKDEFDKNERLKLNFGHTFGHAIESSSNFKISHGIAVGLGIIFAIKFNKIYFKINPSKNEILLHQFLILILKNFTKLKKQLINIKINNFCSALSNDKKSSIAYYKFILPTKHKNLDIFKIRKNNLDIINISKSIFKNLLKNEI
jgi:3-dehydroquinate synthase